MFVSNADHVDDVPAVPANQPQYASYRFTKDEWSAIHKIHDVLKVSLHPFINSEHLY